MKWKKKSNLLTVIIEYFHLLNNTLAFRTLATNSFFITSVEIGTDWDEIGVGLLKIFVAFESALDSNASIALDSNASMAILRSKIIKWIYNKL